ncbi:histidine kinase N-terminal 7TM domain-containing protein [Haloarchaeobius sp. TZWSO28]|uniref:histidine kinase N-terminal 7TM domain-containing protein n=1 Tax=Haloarchaeobius sp. TZWSO28 TaxID=3446119 RepID=UPI003EC146B5
MFLANPFTAMLLAIATVMVTLAAYALRERGVPGALPFAGMTLGIACWTGIHGLRIATTDLDTYVLLANVEWVGILLVTPAWLLFTLGYTGRHDRLSSRLVGLLAVQSLATLFLIFTNDAHGWFRTVESFQPAGPGLATWELAHGPAYWVTVGYVYLVVLLGSIILLRLAVGVPQLYRGRTSAVLVGVAVPWLGTVSTLFDVRLVDGLNTGPLAFAVSMVAFSTALFGHRLFAVLPVSPTVAADAVVERMAAGVIVLDSEGRITETNQAADEVLDIADPVGSRLAAIDEELATVAEADETRKLLLEDDGGRERYFTVESEPMYRAGDLLVGRLLTLHDVTERVLREQRLNVLNRVLRHNVRHETNLIIGHGDLLEPAVADAGVPHLTALLDAADRLVDWSDRARYVERALDDVEVERCDIDVGTTIGRAVERVQERYPDASVTTPTSTTEAVLAHTTLEWALFELVENAVEHHDDPYPWVAVGVESASQSVTITVTDTGPGIPPAELRVLESGEETPLEHGSGLGLWLVNWTIRSAGGDIEFAENDPRGTEVRITLPRST